jgi:hypothetical protein
MEILSGLLKERRIEVFEAGGSLAPGQQVFCQKICSKIIQSRFCIVLLNHETVGTVERPNPNVHMEYGLMLGFNKYIIPFQHNDYSLAFNIAGLDTVKYDAASFKARAETAIDQALSQTAPAASGKKPLTPDISAYLLLHDTLVSPTDSGGDLALYQLGATCGFNLCVDFSGNRYTYFGNFQALQPRVIEWRVKKLISIIDGRIEGGSLRVAAGIATAQQMALMQVLRQTLQIWLLVNSADDRDVLLRCLTGSTVSLNIFTVADVFEKVSGSPMY